MGRNKKNKRLGEERYNNQGCLMKIIEYSDANNITVEFQDENKSKVKTFYRNFLTGGIVNPYIFDKRLGEERLNNQGCLMKIIEYDKFSDIVVEFQDEYNGKVHTNYSAFTKGNVKNPYYPSVHGVGMIGTKYPAKINRKNTKEYDAWHSMLQRCYDKKFKNKHTEYENVTCCEEWFLFENFYEWLHSQENFKKWYDGERWSLDKDILVKGNKLYSPETCCLVPANVNNLFVKSDAARGDYPIGVTKNRDTFIARCNNPFTNKTEFLGSYSTENQSFKIYKSYKENAIKKVAELEYHNNNIIKKCYEAMINYQVEIDD